MNMNTRPMAAMDAKASQDMVLRTGLADNAHKITEMARAILAKQETISRFMFGEHFGPDDGRQVMPEPECFASEIEAIGYLLNIVCIRKNSSRGWESMLEYLVKKHGIPYAVAVMDKAGTKSGGQFFKEADRLQWASDWEECCLTLLGQEAYDKSRTRRYAE